MRVALAVWMAVALAMPAAAQDDPVSWSEAGAHVGTNVVIEGFVREVLHEGRRVTLLFDPADPRALRVTLLIPLVTDLPPEPGALYRERRVQVRGRIIRTAGHVDMVVTDPDRISVVGLTSAPTPVEAAAGPLPATVAPLATTIPSPRPSPPSTAGPVVDPACERLTASRDSTRREALAAVDALRACLESGRAGCITATDAVAPPVARLEWIEQQLRERCPSSR